MNILERTGILYKAAKDAYDLPLVEKALSDTTVEPQTLNRALYEFHNRGQLIVPMYDSERASKAYVTNDDIYSIINYIITTAAPIPWRVMVRQSDGTAKPENGDLQYRLDNPNPYQGWPQVVGSALGYKLLTGNTYLWAPRLETGVNKGKTREIHVLPANLTKIVFGSTEQPVGGYKVSYTNYSKADFKPEDVMHSKYFNPDIDTYGDMYGLSPIRAAAKKIAISHEGDISMGTAFHNGGPEGVLARDGEEFTKNQSDNLVERFRQLYSGSRNRGKIAVTGATVKWIPLGLSPVDLKIIESQNWTFEKIRNIYRFPDNVLSSGDKGTTFNNKDSGKKQLYTACVIPELRMLVEDFNRWLPMYYDTSGKTYVELDTSGIEELQEDKKAQADWLNTAWWVTVDRRQQIQGEQVDEQMKGVYAIPTNVQLVKDIAGFLSDALPDTDVEELAKELKGKGLL